MNTPQLQSCSDLACGVHGRGAPLESHEVVCARQILRAYDRPGAIALLEQQPVGFVEFGEERLPMSLATNIRILPGQQCQIRGRANSDDPARFPPALFRRFRAFRPDSLIFGTVIGAGASDWIVHDLVMDGRSQLAPHCDLPGAFFNAHGSMRVFDRISGDANVELTLTYVGSNPLGEAPAAALVGAVTYERRSIKLGGGHLVVGEVRELTVRTEEAIEVFRVRIQGPTDRIAVTDIRYGGVSQLKAQGDIPGRLCACENLIPNKTLAAGEEVTMVIKCLVDVDDEPIECTLLGQEPEPRR